MVEVKRGVAEAAGMMADTSGGGESVSAGWVRDVPVCFKDETQPRISPVPLECFRSAKPQQQTP